MIDLDIYYPNKAVEEILESLKTKLNKGYSPIKVYISTVDRHDPWLKKLYEFYYKKEDENG
jgi:hypothetical protein